MTEQLIMEESGKRYRMLQVGETMQAGDEVRHENGTWDLFFMPEREPNTVMAPSAGFMPYGYYRRPIQ